MLTAGQRTSMPQMIQTAEVAHGSSIPEPTRRELGFWRLLAINTFKFGDGVHWTPITNVLLPLSATLVAAAEGPLVVSKTTSAGAVCAVVVPILVGYLSDRTSTRFGRRKPWMVVLNAMGQTGTVAGLAALTLLLHQLGSTRLGAQSGYLVIALILTGSLLVSLAAIPKAPMELIRRAQSGVSPTVLTAGAALLATLVAFEFVLLMPISWLQVAVGGLGLGAAIVTFVAGARIAEARVALAPLGARDFFWVLSTRFLNTFGVWTIAPCVFFFFKDVVKSSNPGYDSSLWLLALIGGGVVPAVVGGYLSDRLGGRRKLFVYLSSGLQAAVASVLMFTLVHDPRWSICSASSSASASAPIRLSTGHLPATSCQTGSTAQPRTWPCSTCPSRCRRCWRRRSPVRSFSI